jgi:hypothetical protein
MKLLFSLFVVLRLIGGRIKLLDAHLPILDYPMGSPMQQPRIRIQQPNLHLP